MASNIRRTRAKFSLHIWRRGTSTGRISSRQSFAQPHHQYQSCRKVSGLYTLIFMVHYGRRDRQTERQQETHPALGPKGLIVKNVSLRFVQFYCFLKQDYFFESQLMISAHFFVVHSGLNRSSMIWYVALLHLILCAQYGTVSYRLCVVIHKIYVEIFYCTGCCTMCIEGFRHS